MYSQKHSFHYTYSSYSYMEDTLVWLVISERERERVLVLPPPQGLFFLSLVLLSFISANSRICLYPPAREGCRLFRSVDASSMGKFSFFTCEVLRVQQAKPKLLVAAYECEECHEKVFQPVRIFPSFLPSLQTEDLT